MKTKSLLLTVIAAFALAWSAVAQANPPSIADTPPPQWPTNLTTGLAVLDAALSIVPSINRNITNGPASFQANEFELAVGPVSDGTALPLANSPKLGTVGEYYFLKWAGAGAELVTLNNSAGQGSLDSGSLYAVVRAPLGNAAFFGQGGVYRDWHIGQWEGLIGGGLEYRYNNGLALRWQTAYHFWGDGPGKGEFMSGLFVAIHF